MPIYLKCIVAVDEAEDEAVGLLASSKLPHHCPEGSVDVEAGGLCSSSTAASHLGQTFTYLQKPKYLTTSTQPSLHCTTVHSCSCRVSAGSCVLRSSNTWNVLLSDSTGV